MFAWPILNCFFFCPTLWTFTFCFELKVSKMIVVSTFRCRALSRLHSFYSMLKIEINYHCFHFSSPKHKQRMDLKLPFYLQLYLCHISQHYYSIPLVYHLCFTFEVCLSLLSQNLIWASSKCGYLFIFLKLDQLE